MWLRRKSGRNFRFFALFNPAKAVVIFLIALLLAFGVFGGAPLSADEYADARVGFGAFADGLYDFAQVELERFLRNYPQSELGERVRVVLLLCSLETGACKRAASLLPELKKTSGLKEFGVDPARLGLRLGNCFLAAGDVAAGREIFSQLIKEHPQTDSAMVARFDLSRRFFAEKNFTSARSLVLPLLTALEADQKRLKEIDRRAVCELAARSLYQLKDFKAALPLLMRLSDDPQNSTLTPIEQQEFFALMIECAWHVQAPEVFRSVLSRWLKLPEKAVELDKLSASLQLAARRLQELGRLAELRPELMRGVSLNFPRADKIVLYGFLLEIDRKNEAALRQWLEATVALYPTASKACIKHLRALLLLDHKAADYGATIAVGGRLKAVDSDFWQREDFYYPFVHALYQKGDCCETVSYVPAFLPACDKSAPLSPRRYALDVMAGNCLQKLERFAEAADFYRSIYEECRDPAARLELLASLHRLAPKIENGEGLEAWVSAEVISSFSLDKRRNEKLLRDFPELVLLVADHFFKAQAYAKAQPSLLWLENLALKGELADRVTFLLAEVYYHGQDLAEALSRYQALYDSNSRSYRYPAALRLVAIHEVQGHCEKQKKLYQDLLGWEADPQLKAEFKRKLEGLQAGVQ